MLEVLATAAIMAIVLPIAMYGISLCMHTASNARHESEAATLADGKLQELAALAQLPQASSGNTAGDFGDDFPGYKWQCTTTQMDLNMEQLDVRVTWVARNQEHGVDVSTWVYLASAAATSTTGAGQ